MSDNVDTTAGAPCWIQLFTSDPDAAGAFYRGLLGWTRLPGSPDFGGYFMFEREGAMVSGGMPNSPEMGIPDCWVVFLRAGDARATLDSAREHGATVTAEAMDVADLGVTAFMIDPAGSGIGLWEPRGFPGLASIGDIGHAAWFELHTRSYDVAVAFYRDVFGWDAQPMSDTPEFRYTTLGAGDAAKAGIMDATALPEDAIPTGWNVYFCVADVDEALTRVDELGGTVVMPAEDTPYGRLATATDPTGARFRLIGARSA